MRRWMGALTAWLVAVIGLLLVLFASQCAIRDRTVGTADLMISVAPGETVIVSSDYTGGIDSLPAGATLCVASGATLTALYMNNAAGAIVVAAGATLNMPSVAVSTGF